MLYEFIAAIAAAVALAGIAMGLRWMSRGRLPKWIVPLAAGAGMLAYSIWSEYSWFDRATGILPQGSVVTYRNEDSAFWRPWSYYKPVVNRFTAVETASARRHPGHPGEVLVNVVLAARWQSLIRIQSVFDCVGHRRADIVGSGVSIAEDGAITGARWIDLAADDPAMVAACEAN